MKAVADPYRRAQLARLSAERDPARCAVCETPSESALCPPCRRVLNSERVTGRRRG